MEIWFARHGQTEDNIKGIYQGWRDGVLTALGRQQCTKLGQRLQKETFNYIYSSDLGRAKDTTQLIVEQFQIKDIPIEFNSLLRERSGGVMEGGLFQNVDETAQKLNIPIREFKPEGGES